MCLSLAVKYPDRVLGRGEHLGFEWLVTHNNMGHRCGYVRVPAGHPWHGKDRGDVDVRVHGGLTFGEPDVDCDKGGPDDAHWFGCDFAHAWDLPDPSLPVDPRFRTFEPFLDMYNSMESLGLFGQAPNSEDHLWTQEEVEDECRRVCEQAAAAVASVDNRDS